MKLRTAAFFVLVAGLAAPIAPLWAQQANAPDPLREKALELFKYETGVWRSRWETPRPDGTVDIAEGGEIFTPTLDGSALELVTRTDGGAGWSKAIRFYSPREKQIVFISVSTAGDYFVMRQDVETEIVEYGPYTRADGREAMFRFRITRKTANEQDIVMEYSFDRGETWEVRRYQYMHRVDG